MTDPSKNPNSVKMIADLGKGEPFNAGHCHPSQARILVKKKLAEWRDGKLLVMLRPIHIAVAMNTLTLPGEERVVSEEEVERRQNWFRSILMGVANSDTHRSDLGKILGYHLDEGMRVAGPRDTVNIIQALSIRRQEEIQDQMDQIMENADPEPDNETDNSWYDPDVEPPSSVSDEELVDLWLGGFMGHPMTPEALQGAFGNIFSEGETRHHPLPVYMPEDIEEDEHGNPGVLLIPLPLWGSARTDEVRKRDGTFMEKDVSRTCPSCGQGEDTDGDGNCPLCKNRLKIPVAR